MAQAQFFYTAGSEALGESGRASVEALGAHFMNPAAVALTNQITFGGAFQSGRPTLGNPFNTSLVEVVDNRPEATIAGGFAYLNRRSSTPSTVTIDQDLSISLAKRILPTVAIGILGHRWIRNNNIGPNWAKNNLNFGILAQPATFLGLAFVSYDMLNDDDLDMVNVLSLGSYLNIMDILHIQVDVTQPQKRNPNGQGSANAGIEFNLNYGFLLRAGEIWDTLNQQNFWTAGMGWTGPNLSLSYAYKANINVAGDYWHTMTLWLNF